MVAGAHIFRLPVTALKRCAFPALVAAIVLVVPGAATAQPPRAASGLQFTTKTPGASTGLSLSIDYSDPAHPGGKPYSVQTVLETLASGAHYDTAAPVRCTASDAQLMAQGQAACPAASKVGSGEIDLDTGSAAQREIKNHATFFNAAGEQIFLTESTNTPTTARAVVRAPVNGGTLRSSVPPIPGTPPPDAFTAVKRVKTSYPALRRNGRNYVTTPPSCPSSGRWVNSVAFTYRDGLTQTVNNSVPCTRRTPRLALRLTGRRSRTSRGRRCFTGRVRATVVGADRGLVTSARFSGGRLDTHSPFSRIVDARRHRGRSHIHRARARVRLVGGGVARLRHRYRVCADAR